MRDYVQTPDLEPGDEAILIGNFDDWDPEYQIGTKLRLIRFDESDGSWFAADKQGLKQWVGYRDVAPVPEVVTDEDVEAAIASIKEAL